ncbi:mRNA-decapping enzyme subunit 2 [Paecilomyces lecythidis]
MAETKMQLEDWLDDLCVRFIINLPREELESVERICFQVEEAQWFYEDFIRPLDPGLPSLSLKAFAMRIFQHCPLMSQWSHYHHITAFSEFLAYKTRVPVRGAIMLNEEMDEVVLVKGWKKGANWSFPRGKINKDEKDIDCAIREVYEETGFDLKEAGLVREEKEMKYIEITMREQHMRLYVFRGVPKDTYFEPRTRKEISKIEWYKLSDLPTLKKNKQHDEGFTVANANKFYMVAPFLHPLKKWIAQQKKHDERARVASGQLQQTEGETSMDEAIYAANGALTPKRELLQEAGPSDLPEATAPQDVSSHLKRILNINGSSADGRYMAEVLQPATTDSAKSNALLALLKGGSNGAPQPGSIPMPQNHANAPVSQDSAFPFSALAGTRGSVQFPSQFGPPGLPSYPPSSSFPLHHGVHGGRDGPASGGLPSVAHLPQQRPMDRPDSFMGYRGELPHPQQIPAHQPQTTLSRSMQESVRPVPGHPDQHYAPAPYQRTGDPEFAQPSQHPNVQGPAIPPASRLPPPKLTSHSLALLNVFKDPTPKTPKTPGATLAPKPDATPDMARRASQHQDSLLNLLKGVSPAPPARPAELSAQAVSPAAKQILQRPAAAGTPPSKSPAIMIKKRQDGGGQTSATVSGPLNMPDFERAGKNHSKKTNGTPRKGTKDRLSSPITILPRPSSAKKESPVSAERSAQSPRRRSPAKTPEPSKPFQPQILRRTENANLETLFPSHTVTVHEFTQPGHSDKPTGMPKETPAAPLNYDRRPSQTATQKETLLSLFGRSPSQRVQPLANQAELPSTTAGPSMSSANISPLLASQTRAESVGSGGPDRVTSPVNKAFLLGYLQNVAKGH